MIHGSIVKDFFMNTLPTNSSLDAAEVIEPLDRFFDPRWVLAAGLGKIRATAPSPAYDPGHLTNQIARLEPGAPVV